MCLRIVCVGMCVRVQCFCVCNVCVCVLQCARECVQCVCACALGVCLCVSAMRMCVCNARVCVSRVVRPGAWSPPPAFGNWKWRGERPNTHTHPRHTHTLTRNASHLNAKINFGQFWSNFVEIVELFQIFQGRLVWFGFCFRKILKFWYTLYFLPF